MSQVKVLKVGGSLLSKSDEVMFDFAYFYKLKRHLQVLINKKAYKFAINVGGGFVCRKYQALLQKHGERDVVDIHKIGVATTNLNAQIFNGLLGDVAFDDVIRYKDYENFISSKKEFEFGSKDFVVSAGSRPGQSNDWNAVQLALKLGANAVYDLKDVSGVYSADPKEDPTAERIGELTWDDYLNIIGNPDEHKPGSHYPVDPIAAKLAKEHKLKFYVVDGNDLENLDNVLEETSFEGTTIK